MIWLLYCRETLKEKLYAKKGPFSIQGCREHIIEAFHPNRPLNDRVTRICICKSEPSLDDVMRCAKEGRSLSTLDFYVFHIRVLEDLVKCWDQFEKVNPCQ